LPSPKSIGAVNDRGNDMQPVATLLTLFSILFPTKLWFAPDQPMTVRVSPEPGGEVTLVLTDFTGRLIEARRNATVATETTVDLKQLFQPILTPGTYVLWAVPKGKALPEFAGTPLVISVREDRRLGSPPGAMIVRVSPLVYATIDTAPGAVTVAFFYDVAPNTVSNFVLLALGGFYDGLTFHRVVPGFVIQGGDPRADGTGGPGYAIQAEFSDRAHREGVLSMSRQADPLEAQGAMPRPEAAHSAGSQFFICLNYARTQQLDGRYTAFAKVVGDGMKVVEQIAQAPAENERPREPQVIRAVRIEPVTPGKNPYEAFMNFNLAPEEERP
jgi:cyclophilin family peptidyl-prolyl cis-trans isomerase